MNRRALCGFSSRGNRARASARLLCLARVLDLLDVRGAPRSEGGWRWMRSKRFRKSTKARARFVFKKRAASGATRAPWQKRRASSRTPPERRASRRARRKARAPRGAATTAGTRSRARSTGARRRPAARAASASVQRRLRRRACIFDARARCCDPLRAMRARCPGLSFAPPPCLAPRSRWRPSLPARRRRGGRRAPRREARTRARASRGARGSAFGYMTRPAAVPARARVGRPASPARGGARGRRRDSSATPADPGAVTGTAFPGSRSDERRAARVLGRATRCARFVPRATKASADAAAAGARADVRYKPSLFTRPSLPVDAVAVLSAALADKSRDDDGANVPSATSTNARPPTRRARAARQRYIRSRILENFGVGERACDAAASARGGCSVAPRRREPTSTSKTPSSVPSRFGPRELVAASCRTRGLMSGAPCRFRDTPRKIAENRCTVRKRHWLHPDCVNDAPAPAHGARLAPPLAVVKADRTPRPPWCTCSTAICVRRDAQRDPLRVTP